MIVVGDRAKAVAAADCYFSARDDKRAVIGIADTAVVPDQFLLEPASTAGFFDGSIVYSSVISRHNSTFTLIDSERSDYERHVKAIMSSIIATSRRFALSHPTPLAGDSVHRMIQPFFVHLPELKLDLATRSASHHLHRFRESRMRSAMMGGQSAKRLPLRHLINFKSDRDPHGVETPRVAYPIGDGQIRLAGVTATGDRQVAVARRADRTGDPFLYGPYLKLKPGRYEFCIALQGLTDSPTSITMEIDVCCESGARILDVWPVTVTLTAGDLLEVLGAFEIDEYLSEKEIETRVWSEAENSFALVSYEFREVVLRVSKPD